MARYWVYGPPSDSQQQAFQVPNDPNPQSYRINLKVAFLGSDVPGGVIQGLEIQAEPLFTDTPAAIAAMVIDQVVNRAISLGLTVTRSAGVLPSFVRGS